LDELLDIGEASVNLSLSLSTLLLLRVSKYWKTEAYKFP
jgi:hypothetical protein